MCKSIFYIIFSLTGLSSLFFLISLSLSPFPSLHLKKQSRSTIHLPPQSSTTPPPPLQHIIFQPKNQWKIKPKINRKWNPKSIKKSNQNSRSSCYRRYHGSLGGVFAAAMREWRFGPLFVAVLQLTFRVRDEKLGRWRKESAVLILG